MNVFCYTSVLFGKFNCLLEDLIANCLVLLSRKIVICHNFY